MTRFVDQLERRRLLSSASLRGSTLVVNGEFETANTIAVSVDGSNASVVINGGAAQTFALSAFDQAVVRGGQLADTLSVLGNFAKRFRIFGFDGNDTVTVDSTQALVYGGRGNDSITTGAGNDRVWGFEGNDSIVTGDGNDVVHAGGGNDFVNGGAGNDRLWGGNNSDTLDGGDGDDLLIGGRGDDTYNPGAGRNLTYAILGGNVVNIDAAGFDRVILGNNTTTTVNNANANTIIRRRRGSGGDDAGEVGT